MAEKTEKQQKKNSPRNQFIKSILIMIILLSAVEGLLWVLEDKNDLPEPYAWGSRPVVTYKINQCKELFSRRENQGKIKILLIGDSRAQTSFDPHFCDIYFRNLTISYNLGITGFAINAASLVIQKVVIPKIRPDIIIWQIGAYDFIKNHTSNEGDRIAEMSPNGRYYDNNIEGLDLEGYCEFLLFKYSRIFRYRSVLIPSFLNFDSSLEDNLDLYSGLFDRGYRRRYQILKDVQPTKFLNITVTNEYDEEAESLFLETKDSMIKSDIKFLLVYGPFRNKRMIFPRLDSIFDTFPSDNLINLNGNETFLLNRLYVEDKIHFNQIGAKLHTEIVCKKIENELL
ncbi:MAG: hypothetical protein ACXADY_03315 [Candidatus Hodarchaeales archaeon]|jgi:hypothetical protein